MESPEGGLTHIRLACVWTDIELCQCRSMGLLLSPSLSRFVSESRNTVDLPSWCSAPSSWAASLIQLYHIWSSRWQSSLLHIWRAVHVGNEIFHLMEGESGPRRDIKLVKSVKNGIEGLEVTKARRLHTGSDAEVRF